MRKPKITNTLCWLDVFDKTHLAGRMHRHFGPRKLDGLTAASVIVGPQARLEIRGQCKGKPVVLELHPRRIIPNLQAFAQEVKIESASVHCALAQVDKPQ